MVYIGGGAQPDLDFGWAAGITNQWGRFLDKSPRSPPATIIIPLLRQDDSYLEQCGRSALDQSVPVEVIVVLSPETPQRNIETLRSIEGDSSRLRIVMRQREGFAAALNTGIEHARSERIGFLLSDDWLEPTAVEECLRHDADIVSTDRTYVNADGTGIPFGGEPRTAEAYSRLERVVDKADYLGYFFLFKKSALRGVGGVDERVGLTGADDFDLIWSLLEAGATVSLVEKKLYVCRDHAGERLTLRDPALQVRDLKKVLEKHGITGPERERLIESHTHWFGKTLLAASLEQMAAEGVRMGPRSLSGAIEKTDAPALDMAFMFVTFLRPGCAQRLIRSVRQYYPSMPIHVGDQSGASDEMAAFYRDYDVNYRFFPFDSGVGYCRSRLVEEIENPLILYGDDDYVFTENTSFTVPARILEEGPEIGLVGGRSIDVFEEDGKVTRQARRYEKLLHLDRDKRLLVSIPIEVARPPTGTVDGETFYYCDMVLNFALCCRELFDDPRIRWDDRLKVCEHEDFFLQVKHHSPYKVVFYPGLECDHLQDFPMSYEVYRNRTEMFRVVGEKWGVDAHLELGSRFESFV